MDGNKIAVRVISDGSFLLDGGPMFGPVPKILWERAAKPDRKNRVRLGLNSLLIATPEANVLVDVGIGSKEPEVNREIYGHSSSKLQRNLREHGVSIRDINFVILTHLHFDHCGGSTRLDRDGNIIPTFPNARYLVQRTAWEEAFNPNERAIPVYGHGIEHLKVLEERGMIDFLDGDTEVTPGVHAIVTDGYSSGHMIVTVNAGSERVVFLSDLIPTPHHLPLPYITAFDRFPEQTLKAKKELLERAEREGLLMVFSHGYDDRAGYLKRDKNGLSLNPVAF